MDLEQLKRAVDAFRNGRGNAQKREVLCFLFDNYWFPVHATVRLVSEGHNTETAISDVLELRPYTRFKKVHVSDNAPVPLNDQDRLAEISMLAERIKELATMK